ncbi:hypothetical protein [Bacillus alkalicellulosilyticus]|uniref:hypothetical protein n=1 Tax=Alkalihalobacterium alkalicellulosilyticum TaxID=1912214 RepID=UPI0009983DE2|nr:hypothetical protein [Bacillus alkalicellulosilyticus]
MLNQLYWILSEFLIVILVVLAVIVVILYVRKLDITHTLKYIIISIAIVIGLYLIMSVFNYTFYSIFHFIEWMTKYILPWVVLYWLVRAIKAYETKS